MRAIKVKIMKYNSQLNIQTQQTGAGMLEVLIALLVLSIGILGLATLQSIGLKYNHQSYQRTQAIMQIYDMTDRIRSNAPGKGAAYNDFAEQAAPVALTKDCTSDPIPCTSGERALFDFERWQTSLEDYLGPTARGRILRLNPKIHMIRVTWDENDIRKNFVYEAQL